MLANSSFQLWCMSRQALRALEHFNLRTQATIIGWNRAPIAHRRHFVLAGPLNYWIWIVLKLLELEIVSQKSVITFCFDKIGDTDRNIDLTSRSCWKLLEKMLHNQPIVEKKRDIFRLMSKTFLTISFPSQDVYTSFRTMASENLEMHLEASESQEEDKNISYQEFINLDSKSLSNRTFLACTKFAYMPW